MYNKGSTPLQFPFIPFKNSIIESGKEKTVFKVCCGLLRKMFLQAEKKDHRVKDLAVLECGQKH